MSRTAVVLFNLGAPDSLESVSPFLFNLFNDRAIIDLPQPLRHVTAQLIAALRAPTAWRIYKEMGGASPLLANTEAQARALEAALASRGTDDVRVFVAMRYWRPRGRETAEKVRAFAPERVVLLPLYPQFSTTTTASSLADWDKAARAAGLSAPIVAVCCYPDEEGLIAEMAALIAPALLEAWAKGRPRLLFSAHGLPERVVAKGDPYPWQVERTAAAVAARLGDPSLDWRLCYQSRVGPLAWIGPTTPDEIRRAGAERVPVVVAPIAFVSEHSETLVELDIEYRRLAEESGVPLYVRAPTVATGTRYIEGLARLVEGALARGQGCGSGGREAEGSGRLCPLAYGRCPVAAR